MSEDALAEPAALAAEPLDPAEQHLKRNIFFNTLHQFTLLSSESFAAYTTILPVFAATLTNSPILIGLVPAIFDAGWLMPQMFFAPVLERMPRRKPVILIAGVIERLPYLLFALLAGWMASSASAAKAANTDVFVDTSASTNWPIIIFLLLLSIRAFTGGFAGLAWQDFIAKTTPARVRGRFFGFSQLGGKLLGLSAAALAGLILTRQPYPQNYSLLFLLTFIGLCLSLLFISLTKEFDGERPPAHEGGRTAFRERVSGIIKRDPNFVRYLINRGLAYLGSMAFGFVAVYAVQTFHLDDVYAANFTSVMLVATIISLLVWGSLRDRFGARVVLIIASAAYGAAMLALLLWRDITGVYVAFALIGVTQPGNLIAELNMPMEFEGGPYRPTYIGMARTLPAPLLLISPVIGGLIIQTGGYTPLFITALAFGAAGLALLIFGVKDPRQRG
jgi:MFS family permease